MIGFALVLYAAVDLLLFGMAKIMSLEEDYDKRFTFCFLFGNTLFVGMPYELAVAMVVLMSLPAITVVPVIARSNGNCGEYAAGATAVTLAVSVVTVPVV